MSFQAFLQNNHIIVAIFIIMLIYLFSDDRMHAHTKNQIVYNYTSLDLYSYVYNRLKTIDVKIYVMQYIPQGHSF